MNEKDSERFWSAVGPEQIYVVKTACTMKRGMFVVCLVHAVLLLLTTSVNLLKKLIYTAHTPVTLVMFLPAEYEEGTGDVKAFVEWESSEMGDMGSIYSKLISVVNSTAPKES